jgi:two-component system sensor histidine kinase BaeS
VESSREAAAEKSITVAVEREGAAAVSLLADPEALSMICGNLVENAVKYSRDGGRVKVRIRREGIYVTVSVADDGIGISAEDCGRVFDEFYRVRGEQTAGIPGTGLGLSLVKRLTELHEGTVTVTSTLGQGSEFTVRIPAVIPGS